MTFNICFNTHSRNILRKITENFIVEKKFAMILHESCCINSKCSFVPIFYLLFQMETSLILLDSGYAADDSCQLQQEPSARFGDACIIAGKDATEINWSYAS